MVECQLFIWLNSSNVQCLKDQMVQNVDGELIFDEDLIYEYLKKDQAQLTDEEQQMLIDVIATLQETVSVGAEIDIGGMVDTICDTAESAWNGLKKGWKTFTSWF